MDEQSALSELARKIVFLPRERRCVVISLIDALAKSKETLRTSREARGLVQAEGGCCVR